MRALAEVAKLALELAARGRVLPAVERRDSAPTAAWRPVLTDEADAERAAALRRSLPEACAACEPEADPGETAALALAALTDACVRRALSGWKPAPAAPYWLGALAGDRPEDGPAEPVAAALAAWAAPLRPSGGDAGLRTCFLLSAPVEPAEGEAAADAPWRLDFLLQAADDPSLLVPAEQVWRTRGPLTVLRRTLDSPQERLLGDLGRALRLHPPLRGARPTGVELDAGAAYRFLREGAPLLAQAGFGVRVPGWWGKPAERPPRRSRSSWPTRWRPGAGGGSAGSPPSWCAPCRWWGTGSARRRSSRRGCAFTCTTAASG